MLTSKVIWRLVKAKLQAAGWDNAAVSFYNARHPKAREVLDDFLKLPLVFHQGFVSKIIGKFDAVPTLQNSQLTTK